LSWSMKDTTTKSCAWVQPAASISTVLNAIATETVAPKSNNSHLVLWFFSTASSNCEPRGAVTSERKNKERGTSIYLQHTHKTVNNNPQSRNGTQ
jgi:hypothetical protein